VKKRTAALIFLAFVLALAGASLAALRTEWAGGRVCSAAAARVEAATGLHLGFQACRLDLFGLAVVAEGVELGPPEAPLFAADVVSARLAAVQALGSQIHLERLSLTRPRLTARLSQGGGGGTCPPAFLARFDVRNLTVEHGALDLTLPGGRVTVQDLEVRSSPAPRTLRSLARASRRAQLSIATGPAAVALGGRSFTAARLLAQGELAPDLSFAALERVEAEVGGARLGLSGTVRDLCAPKLDLTATAAGPVPALLALAGVPALAGAAGEATVSAHAKGALADPRALELSGKVVTRGVTLGGFRPGDTEAEVRLARGSLVVDALRVPFAGGKLAAHGTIRLAPGLPFTGEGDLAGVDLAEVLDRLTVNDPWITVRLDGKAKLQGPLWPPRLAGRLELSARDLAVFTRPARLARSEPPVLAFDRARVDSDVRVDTEGLFFERARIAAGRGVAEAGAAIRFSRAGGFSVQVRGDADLDVLRRIDVVPWSGLATVDATVAAAPYGMPRVAGRVRATGFRFLDLSLGTVAGALRFEGTGDRLLHLEDVEGSEGPARYRGEAVVDLFARPVRVVSARYQAHGPVRALCDAVLDRLPRAAALRDALEGDAEVGGTARGPAAALDADFEAQVGAGVLYGRRIDGASAAGHIRAAAEARFDRLEVRRGGGAARAAGTWGMEPPFPWALEVAVEALPLGGLELPGSWTGTATGRAAVAGTVARPQVKVAAEVSGATVQGLRIGAGKVEARLDGDQLSGVAHAEGVELSGELTLSGRQPFRARGKVALDDAGRLLEGAPAGFKARLAGEGAVEGDLADWREARFEGTLAQLAASYADLRVATTAPARVSGARGRWELAPVTLEGPNTRLTVAGAVLPGGGLDAAASGGCDLRLLSGLVPTLRRAGGRLEVEAHLAGTLDAPLLVGSGKVVDAALQLKGTTASFTEVNGVLAFSQNRVIFDRLDATVNGGRATFKGEVELDRLVPARLRAEGVLDEVPVAVPSYLPATLSGRVQAEGTPEATTVTGRLHVTRARYTADVDLEGKVMQRHAPPPPPRPYDRAGEWLRFDLQLAVDGDVRVENDLVRGPVSGELTLAGSLAAPGLVGSLAMGHGSKALFRGNEFDLSHAVLDFTDRARVQIELDVHGESQVRDYQVFLAVNGTLDAPRVKLTSLPDLPEQDIVTLLSLGFTRRDAGAQGGVTGVATATAAQALLSASGLDAQVKRFLPRGGPIRDLSMRVTTGYSEESGQVEPRAEFESWVLKDKLRLRFQTPLGAGRGRQAQAELRLGDHSSLQYQWDNENPDVATGDHGVDLKLRWEWSDDKR
jgi:translocation and assembly module TamB